MRIGFWSSLMVQQGKVVGDTASWHKPDNHAPLDYKGQKARIMSISFITKYLVTNTQNALHI